MSAAAAPHPGLRVPSAPASWVRQGIARAALLRAARRLAVRVTGPDGRVLAPAAAGAPTLQIRRDALFRRLAVDGKIGFGEAYMAGDWSADDLPALLTRFAAGLDSLVPRAFRGLRRLYDPALPRWERNTISGAAANVCRHYDLSNELFALFLDPSMTYSCAIFEPGDTLAAAQRRKHEAICDLAGVGPADHLLEIGSGWGALAIHAAATRGCRVTTATVSREQHAEATRRVHEAGLGDRVRVLLRDYRELGGTYTRIASVEMFEAVGERYWPVFFRTCDRLLAPGGRMALQTITMPHARFLATRRSYTWIHKYVFPGGLIPSPEAVEHAARASRLRIRSRREIGADYVPTLRAWRERFLASTDEVLELGFTPEFVRMWEFYLAYCQAGFAAAAIGDQQLLLARDGAG